MNTDDDVERLMKLAGRRPEVSAEIAARVKNNVRSAWTAEVEARRTRRRFMIALPLAAAAVLAIVMFLRPAQPLPVETPVAIGPVATVERMVGTARIGERVAEIETANGRVALRMTDGTSMRVDSQTLVRIDGPKRINLQRGAIYIDAAQSGIVVRTPAGEVRDIGTKFEVRVADRTVVRVRDGEIAIGEHHAHRGEQIEVTAAGTAIVSRIETWGPGWEWINEIAPAFTVEGKRVSEFMIWFAAESGMEVRFESQAVSRKASTATLHGSTGTLTPLKAADAVLPTAGLRAEVKNGVMTVRQQ
jgi:ferric-dicitrate binding protein FerR (iron transport regulator)